MKNSRHNILFPLVLAAGVLCGILFGQYLGRNRAQTQMRAILSRSGLGAANKLVQTCILFEGRFVDSISMD